MSPNAQPVFEKKKPGVDTRERRVFSVTRGKIRAWGAKSVCSLADQGLTSAAGFGLNILLARWMAAAEYGAFALAFAGYLFLAGFHNVLLLEPLSVIGPARHPENLHNYFRAQIAVHGVLVLPLAAVALVTAAILWRVTPHNPLVGALAGGGAALPFLLFLWLARRMCYVLQRPALAVWGSGAYLVAGIATLLTLRYLHMLTPFSAFISTGFGSLLGAIIVMRRIGLNDPDLGANRLVRRRILAENWTYGRWLVGSAVLYAISTYSQMFFVAGALGLGAAGILRAMQIPSLLMIQIITAIGMLVLPSFSFDFGRGLTTRLRHKATVVSAAIGLLSIGFAVTLAIGSRGIEHVFFAGKYAADARLIPILALIPVLNGLTLGYSMALRASQRSYFDLVSNACAAPVALISAILFTHWWGIGGAALSIVLSFAVFSVVTVIFFRRLVSDQAKPQKIAIAIAPSNSRCGPVELES
jgi:O-antigen/teichoic acid export membrane protein